MHPADVLHLESDVCSQIAWPTANDLHVVELGRLYAKPSASPEYIDTNGCPSSFTDLLKHRIVLQVAHQLTGLEDFSRLFPNTPQVGLVAIRTNVSSAYYWVIARSGGIGVLPTYACALGSKVVPVDLEDARFEHDIWLTYHAGAAKIPRPLYD